MDLLRYQVLFLLFLFSHALQEEILGEEGIKNRDFQFYFFFNLPNNNVGGSVNQSIIKKRPNCQKLKHNA